MGWFKKSKKAPTKPPPAGEKAKPEPRTGSKPRPERKPRGCGCGRLFTDLIVLVFLSFLAAVVILFHRPADLSELAGYQGLVDTDAVAGEGGELLDDLGVAAGGRDAFLISEEALNTYLHSRVVGVQEGTGSGMIRFVGLWCDCKEGAADFYLEREVLGRRSTMSLQLSIERTEGQFVIHFSGGSYGKLRVPAGFAFLMKPAFDELAVALRPELDALFSFSEIAVHDDGLELRPVGFVAAP